MYTDAQFRNTTDRYTIIVRCTYMHDRLAIKRNYVIESLALGKRKRELQTPIQKGSHHFISYHIYEITMTTALDFWWSMLFFLRLLLTMKSILFLLHFRFFLLYVFVVITVSIQLLMIFKTCKTCCTLSPN